MAKQIIHIGLAVSTDGMLPGVDNILGVAASIGKLGSFDQNVLPQRGGYKESPFWSKHPEEFQALQKDAIPLEDAVTKFRAWLEQWQGNLVACTSSLDFAHLMYAMLVTYKGKEKGSGFRFGPLPMDTNTFYAAHNGLKAPKKITEQVTPLAVAEERWRMVSQGVLPKFGPPPKKNTMPQAPRRSGLRPSAPRADSNNFQEYLRQQAIRTTEQLQALQNQQAVRAASSGRLWAGGRDFTMTYGGNAPGQPEVEEEQR